MTTVVRRWWPIGQVDRQRAATALSTIVDTWMMRWVVRPIPFDARAEVAFEATSASKASVRWHSTSGVDLSVRERAWDRIVRAALDLPDQQPMTIEGPAADVVKSLSSAMLDDLMAGMAEGLKVPDLAPMRAAQPGDRSATIDVWITLVGDELLLHASLHDSWLRETLPPSTPAVPAPPVTRRAAMDQTVASLTAVLGSCEISVAELSGLSVGDVLATNTPVDQAIELILRGNGDATTMLGRAAPVRSGNRIALVVSGIDETHTRGALTR